MNIADRIKANFDILETYIREEGKPYGTVSGQMAIQSLHMISDDIHKMIEDIDGILKEFKEFENAYNRNNKNSQ